MSGKTEWRKEFVVSSITREDLCTHGFPRWQAASFSDEEMQEIAINMGTSYGDSFFSEDIESATNFVLCKRTSRKNIMGEPV